MSLEEDDAFAAGDALDDAIVIACAILRRDAGEPSGDRMVPTPLSDRFLAGEFDDGWSAILGESTTLAVAPNGAITLSTPDGTLEMNVAEAFDVADGLDDLLYEN